MKIIYYCFPDLYAHIYLSLSVNECNYYWYKDQLLLIQSWPNSDSNQGFFELWPSGKAWNKTSFCFVSLLNILTKVSSLTSWESVQLRIHPWPWYHITQYYQYHVTEKDCRMDQSKCICQHRLKEETNKSKSCVSMLRTNLDYIATS